MSGFLFVLASVVTLAIFLTTTAGRKILKRIGLRDRVPDAASSEDLAYLLSACGGDRNELDKRVSIERERFPGLSEADHFRRAIRKVFAERKR
ncbi:MAG: hypothetical protein GY910_06100 [bacterium]|nr:hypothetical protein [Deltaproteobacteria bacterium]MCP4904533.1 hypothetical protein [bacterium]